MKVLVQNESKKIPVPVEEPSDSPQPHAIVMASDESYAMPLATALRSLAESCVGRYPLDVYITCDVFASPAREQVLKSLQNTQIRIHWLHLDSSEFARFGTAPHISRMTFARLRIPQILPPEVQRYLYLDTDILVLHDLRPLMTVDLAGAVVAAVVDGLDEPLRQADPSTHGMPNVKSYFNAGVLVVDRALWIAEKVSEKAFEYLLNNPLTAMADQDALNIACDGRWKRLEDRWNYQSHYGTRLSALPDKSRPSIVHFVTGSKPWNPGSCSINAEFYDSFRSRTAFARPRAARILDFITTCSARLANFTKRWIITGWRPMRECGFRDQ